MNGGPPVNVCEYSPPAVHLPTSSIGSHQVRENYILLLQLAYWSSLSDCFPGVRKDELC